ncbi:ATP-binding protein [Bradyrhizobium sp. LB13.1]
MLKLPENLADVLTFDVDTLSVSGREGKHREFKVDFAQKDMSDYTKALAAFANADGGIIIFGVRDRPREIVGIKEVIDEARWADRLREDFAPEIVFSTRTYEIKGKILLAIGTNASPHRPIIAKINRSKKSADKDGKPIITESIREGTIYYRYGGQIRPIGYTELSTMLADRERNRIKAMMENLKVVEKIGIQNVGIVDMKEGSSHLYLSKETARGLSFIDRGRFVEEDGAPASVVLGNVDLNQVIHRPLEDEDKNLPMEVAKHLKPNCPKNLRDRNSLFAGPSISNSASSGCAGRQHSFDLGEEIAAPVYHPQRHRSDRGFRPGGASGSTAGVWVKGGDRSIRGASLAILDRWHCVRIDDWLAAVVSDAISPSGSTQIADDVSATRPL